MRIKILSILLLCCTLGSFAQNKKQLIEFLVHKNDSLQEMFDKHVKIIAEQEKAMAELRKEAEKIAVQADSLLRFKQTFKSQLDGKDIIIRELTDKQVAMSLKKDTVVRVQTVLKTDTVVKTNIVVQKDTIVLTNTIKSKPDTIVLPDPVQTVQIQSLQYRIDSLNFELQKKINLLKNAPPIVEIQGSFVEVDRGDCFHLIFKDVNGVSFDFGSANNALPFEIYSYNVDSDEFTLLEKVKDKKLTLVVALMHGVVCDSADSMDQGKMRFELMPTIIDIRL